MNVRREERLKLAGVSTWFQIRWGLYSKVFARCLQPTTTAKITKGCANSHCITWTMQNKKAVGLLFCVEKCLPQWVEGEYAYIFHLSHHEASHVQVIFLDAQTGVSLKLVKKKKNLTRQAKWFPLRGSVLQEQECKIRRIAHAHHRGAEIKIEEKIKEVKMAG